MKSRHQLIAVTREANPDIPYNSELFRECFLLNASIQEGTINEARLANFTCMSKGEVRRHLINIGKKLKDAETQQTAAENNVAERESMDHRAGEGLDQDDLPASGG